MGTMSTIEKKRLDLLLVDRGRAESRSRAQRLIMAGIDLVAVQQNLGHADVKTTLGYIGTLDAEARKPPAVYDFDLSQLNGKNKP